MKKEMKIFVCLLLAIAVLGIFSFSMNLYEFINTYSKNVIQKTVQHVAPILKKCHNNSKHEICNDIYDFISRTLRHNAYAHKKVKADDYKHMEKVQNVGKNLFKSKYLIKLVYYKFSKVAADEIKKQKIEFAATKYLENFLKYVNKTLPSKEDLEILQLHDKTLNKLDKAKYGSQMFSLLSKQLKHIRFIYRKRNLARHDFPHKWVLRRAKDAKSNKILKVWSNLIKDMIKQIQVPNVPIASELL